MLLSHSKFAVKSKSKLLSSKKSFEIADPESSQLLGTGTDVTGFLGSMLGATKIEVRDSSNNELLFTVQRTGLLLKKDAVIGPDGQLIGRYKSKAFSLSGGFHIYDKDGKHLGEIQGKMLKAEYKVVTPDRTTEMGTVSKSWAGMAKSLLTGGEAYGVQISPQFAEDQTAKILILGATIAVESIFKKKGSKAVGGGDSDEE